MDWRTITFDWNRARAFWVTVEEGSYSAAAVALGQSQPTIGRQVAALEEELGVTLLERVGRGVVPTPAGLDLVEHVREMGQAAMRVSRTAAGQSTSLEGVVCITASEVVTAHLLPPIIERIRALHPRIELELVASNALRDLRRREADIAVRNVRPDDPELVGRWVRDSEAALYASPAYLDSLGPLRGPEDLTNAVFFGFDRSEMMVRGFGQMGVPVTAANFPIVTSNHLVQWELAKRGQGICMMMVDIGDPEPQVQRLPVEVPPFVVPIWLTSHRELRTSRRLRVVFDLLAEGLAVPGMG